MDGLGERLRAASQRFGISDGEMARRLDISARRYGHYVNDQREPPLDLLRQMSEVLGVSLDWLLRGRDGDAGRPIGFAEAAESYVMERPGDDGWSGLAATPGDSRFFVSEPWVDRSRWYLADPSHPLREQSPVWVEGVDGRAVIGAFAGEGALPDSVLIHHRGMADSRRRSSIRRIVPITWQGVTPPPVELTAPPHSPAPSPEIAARLAHLDRIEAAQREAVRDLDRAARALSDIDRVRRLLASSLDPSATI
jgi:transcriptional regulator with XRE-family HTH domain